MYNLYDKAKAIDLFRKKFLFFDFTSYTICDYYITGKFKVKIRNFNLLLISIECIKQ